jgi:alkylation response protein AidB-like acyl-CoA dehydrogenase
MEFSAQPAPRLGNQYADDAWLRSYLRRTLPHAVLADIEPTLTEIGELAGGAHYAAALADRLHEPRLDRYSAWGERIDAVTLSGHWRDLAPQACRFGLVAAPYEGRHGRYSRVSQFASVYLFHPSSDVYTCPLAMTDGAARTLLESGNERLIARAVPRLTSRDPQSAWLSGQWMTELTGGSDVGASTTRAVEVSPDLWRLYGRKWFTSAVTADIALTLARPEGAGSGGRHLALFYVETRDDRQRLNGIRVERLKDKLGTRKVPTAELVLDGTYATPVAGLADGTRQIAPMLEITRAWNSVTAVAFMRRGLALARSYAAVRTAFGRQLEAQPLHVDTLAGLEAETRGAFLLAFQLVELMGRHEAGESDSGQRALLRILTPIVKLATAKQAVAVVSEVVESFGGAGYVEDTGIPTLLRDTQVLPIWEGTTNVLALDALVRGEIRGGIAAILGRVSSCIRSARDPRLAALGRIAVAAVERAAFWVDATHDEAVRAAGARRLALTLARALELALLVEHAQWLLDRAADASGVATARRFAATPVDLLADCDPADSTLLIS